MKQENVSRKIIGLSMKIHRELGNGFNEVVYKKSLAFELSQNGIAFEMEKRVLVFYYNNVVGEYFLDFLVEKSVVVELKAVGKLCVPHFAQTKHYLKATKLDWALLINFGSELMQQYRVYSNEFKTFIPG